MTHAPSAHRSASATPPAPPNSPSRPTPAARGKPAFNIAPGESYTIRRKVLKIFGAAFHIYDAQGHLVGYCRQKAFKLKEDIRIYTDESCSAELLVIRARSIIDFGATYDVTSPEGTTLGSFRRKGLASTFLKDSWLLFDAGGRQIADLKEQGSFLAVLRRYIEYIAFLSPQRFTLTRADGTVLARYRQHFNLFVYRLGVTVLADDPQIDDLMLLAAGCLITAIEGRQSGG
jgi:uncharacterized protein YxjI